MGNSDESKIEASTNGAHADDDQAKWDSDEMNQLLAEAKALNEYLARHGCKGLLKHNAVNGQSDPAGEKRKNLYEEHCRLIDAIAAATDQRTAKSWRELAKVYAYVSSILYEKSGVSGKSILDTLNGRHNGICRCIEWLNKHHPIIIGMILFVVALGFEWCKSWTGGISDPSDLEGFGEVLFDFTVVLEPYIVGALWGAIGACTFLAKKISDKLSEMTYEKNRMKGTLARIFLGAIFGLIVDILFFGQNGTYNPVAAGELQLGTIVLAFLVGLSVKPFYTALETLSESIAARLSMVDKEDKA